MFICKPVQSPRVMTLEHLRSEYEGERIFLVGNGPSLEKTPLDALADEYSIAMKKINHIYPQTDWRPSFYFNPREWEKLPPKQVRFIRENVEAGITCFLESSTVQEFGARENVYYIDRQELKTEPVDPKRGLHAMTLEDITDRLIADLSPFWSHDPTEVLYTYHSMYGTMQLLAYMGFDELYFVGCDLGYGYHDPHMLFGGGLDPLRYLEEGSGPLWRRYTQFLRDSYEAGEFPKSVLNSFAFGFFHTPLAKYFIRATDSMLGGDDPNHFAADYRVKPKDNTYANDQIRKSHAVAKRILAEDGIEVFNATVGGNLEMYPRVDIESVVESYPGDAE